MELLLLNGTSGTKEKGHTSTLAHRGADTATNMVKTTVNKKSPKSNK